jgi:hypothetical protein
LPLFPAALDHQHRIGSLMSISQVAHAANLFWEHGHGQAACEHWVMTNHECQTFGIWN